ncbi:unnamed protein product, partial [Ixodes hexagonus]
VGTARPPGPPSRQGPHQERSQGLRAAVQSESLPYSGIRQRRCGGSRRHQ